MTGEDDAALVARALAGEQVAYTALMARHRDAMFRLARAQTGDPDAALDVTQETFVAAFAALDRYDAARPLRIWLARIAINKCRDHARRRAVRRFLTFARPLDTAAEVADAGASPEESAAARRELAIVERGIAALPPGLREVLVLRAVEGMTQAEVAATLGIGAKAVEMRLYRARRQLSAWMRENALPRV